MGGAASSIFMFTLKNTSPAGGPTIDVTMKAAGPIYHAVIPNYGFGAALGCTALRPGITCVIQTNWRPSPAWTGMSLQQNWEVDGVWEQNPNMTATATFHLQGTVQ
jgi:hypothetical protein